MPRVSLGILLLLATGCGGAGAYGTSSTTSYRATETYSVDQSVRNEVLAGMPGQSARANDEPVRERIAVATAEPTSPSPSRYDFESEEVSAEVASTDSGGDSYAPAPEVRYADATPPAPTPVAGTQRAGAEQNARVMDDAHRGPLLIYTATVHLSVFEVEQTQRSIIDVVRELNGFLQLQNESQVTVRVPAANFRDALARIEATGDVLNRNVEALDVSDEFRDLNVRLQNALSVRDRLQELLARATDTQQALTVEHELERVTLLIEQLRGRMQLLGDRLAFSTITVMFRPRPITTDEPGAFRLPVPWLDELSLSRLLTLPYED